MYNRIMTESSLASTPTVYTRRRIQLEGIGAFLLALGCARAWLTLLFAAPALPLDMDIDAHRIFDLFYFLAAIVLALSARKLTALSDVRWAVPAIGVCMVGASALCSFSAQMGPWGTAGAAFGSVAMWLALAGAVLGGAGFSCFLLVWAEALSHLSLARIALFAALSQLFAVILVFFCDGLDRTRLVLALIILPIVAVAALAHAGRYARGQDQSALRPCDRSWRSVPWKFIAVAAVLCFVYGLRSHQLAAGAGMHSTLSTGIAMAAFAGYVYFFSDRLSLNSLVKSAIPLTLCGFLLIPGEGFLGTVVSSYMISVGYSIMTLLVALMLYDISKRFGIMVLLLFCLKNAMQIFVVLGGDFARFIETLPLASSTGDAMMTIIVVMLIFFVAFVLYAENGLTSTWGIKFMDADALTEEGREEQARTKLCDRLSSEHRLSPREDEILRLYAKGMNGPQIEKELFIAEGTLKTHTRHIYEKLGISSRKELHALLSAGQPVEPNQIGR